jgi:tetratricopeptide (TPR) repeat protein
VGTAEQRGRVSYWASLALLVGGPLSLDVRAGQVQCASLHETVRAIALEQERKLPETPKMSQEAARKKFSKQFAGLDATVSAEGVPFSASWMVSKLWALYGLARASGECSAELSRLLTTVAIVESKRDHPVDASTLAEAALSINDLSTTQSINDAIVLHDLAADAAASPDVAIAHMRAAVELAPRDPSLAPLERFGLRQDLGYWLQEDQLPAEAQKVNAQLLADAERELGKDHAALLGVIENLAQNHYELEQFDVSASYLKRCFELAGKHARPEVESRMLFQLGVLAHEQGNDDEARRYMKERVEHARRNPGAGLLDAAESSMTELEQRIAGMP